MAVAPTEVCIEVVAGQGPPCCWDQVTATPVGQPPNSTRRPGASSAVSSRTSSPSAAWTVAGEAALDRIERGASSVGRPA